MFFPEIFDQSDAVPRLDSGTLLVGRECEAGAVLEDRHRLQRDQRMGSSEVRLE